MGAKDSDGATALTHALKGKAKEVANYLRSSVAKEVCGNQVRALWRALSCDDLVHPLTRVCALTGLPIGRGEGGSGCGGIARREGEGSGSQGGKHQEEEKEEGHSGDARSP